jgi:hypothetical protein
MKKTDLAYIAGLFDGEGSIGIYRKTNKSRKYSYLQCIVQMANEFIPRLLQMHFGGNMFVDKKFHGKNKAVSYRWEVVSRQAVDFLVTVYPYLRLKLAEAKLGIDFQNSIQARGSTRRLSEEELAIREVQILLMKNLKQQGKIFPQEVLK